MTLSLCRANAVKGALVDNSVANDWTYAKMALAVRLADPLRYLVKIRIVGGSPSLPDG